MREELQKQLTIAESKIEAALQEFHDATGLVPHTLDFDAVDVAAFQDSISGKRPVIISNVNLRAST